MPTGTGTGTVTGTGTGTGTVTGTDRTMPNALSTVGHSMCWSPAKAPLEAGDS